MKKRTTIDIFTKKIQLIKNSIKRTFEEMGAEVGEIAYHLGLMPKNRKKLYGTIGILSATPVGGIAAHQSYQALTLKPEQAYEIPNSIHQTTNDSETIQRGGPSNITKNSEICPDTLKLPLRIIGQMENTINNLGLSPGDTTLITQEINNITQNLGEFTNPNTGKPYIIQLQTSIEHDTIQGTNYTDFTPISEFFHNQPITDGGNSVTGIATGEGLHAYYNSVGQELSEDQEIRIYALQLVDTEGNPAPTGDGKGNTIEMTLNSWETIGEYDFPVGAVTVVYNEDGSINYQETAEIIVREAIYTTFSYNPTEVFDVSNTLYATGNNGPQTVNLTQEQKEYISQYHETLNLLNPNHTYYYTTSEGCETTSTPSAAIDMAATNISCSVDNDTRTIDGILGLSDVSIPAGESLDMELKVRGIDGQDYFYTNSIEATDGPLEGETQVDITTTRNVDIPATIPANSPVTITLKNGDDIVATETMSVTNHCVNPQTSINTTQEECEGDTAYTTIYVSGTGRAETEQGATLDIRDSEGNRDTTYSVGPNWTGTFKDSNGGGTYDARLTYPMVGQDGPTTGVDTTEIILEGCTQTNTPELPNAEAIKIYPNPADLFFTIDGLDPKTPYRITVYNLQGQAVITLPRVTSQQRIDISNLSQGVYFLLIQDETGRKTTRKIVKK